MTDRPLATCAYCGEAVDPTKRSTYRRVVGWERKAGRRLSGAHGGSDISLREPLDEWAHPACVDRAKRGVHAHQEALL